MVKELMYLDIPSFILDENKMDRDLSLIKYFKKENRIKMFNRIEKFIEIYNIIDNKYQ